MVLIRAEFAAFSEAERCFEQALRQFEAVLDKLEGELEQSLADWEGDDQKAYAAARARWDQSTRTLHAELARLHRAIGRSHRNFRSSSDTNVRMWST
ncbi:WXG100 family type VII secretion target [Actinomadura rubrisoli]|uniref:WXG100 family type VII secretion target n=1 Tax=Actinomadura rubrisoli TaxID=2530368 RepID=A0A4R4ZTC2_9ACTN|nr:WXG100 family type VII secretion target [Actinomadura rubrisoli]TDD61546.1 WXG100 family type VII secretion target [Actinomadura rubrisoli]